MSKKYIYFKSSAALQDDIDREVLSRLELNTLNSDIKPVQTIFQLMDIPDLKLVISKDVDLQKLLSLNLPQAENHGYLWSGEHIPEVFEKILYSSVTLEECFIFQRNTDPEPDLSDTPFISLAQKKEIYNWWVFCFPTFYKIYRQTLRLRFANESQILFDKAFHEYCIKSCQDTTIPDQISETILFQASEKFNLPLQVLTQACSPEHYFIDCSTLPNIFTVLNGLKFHFVKKSQSENWLLNVYSTLNNLNLHEFSAAIDSILSSIRLLMTGSDHVQTDLFVDPLGKDFLSVWMLEKERLEAAKITLSANNKKAFVVTKYILDRKLGAGETVIVSLLEMVFRQTILQLLNKQSSQDFLAKYQKNLSLLYFDLYVFNKLKDLIKTKSEKWALVSGRDELGVIPSGTVFYKPRDGYLKKMDKIEVQFNRLFNPDISVLAPAGFDEQEIWHDQIGNEGPELIATGKSGKYLFNRLYSQDLETEAVTLFWHWQQINRFLQDAIYFTAAGTEICLILPQIKVQDKYLSVKEIVLESLQDENKKQYFQLQNTIQPFVKPGQDAADIILIVRKQETNVI